LNELSHSALATIAAATCGVQPLPIQKSNIDFAIELVVFNEKELFLVVEDVEAETAIVDISDVADCVVSDVWLSAFTTSWNNPYKSIELLFFSSPILFPESSTIITLFTTFSILDL